MGGGKNFPVNRKSKNLLKGNIEHACEASRKIRPRKEKREELEEKSNGGANPEKNRKRGKKFHKSR